MTGKLIVTRHCESEWNKLGLWTGKRDRHLTQYGFDRSEELGNLLKDIKIDYAFASLQVRTIETLSCVLNVLELYDLPIEHLASLNERDYGDYTGKNKWDMEKILGEEGWSNVRRGWDVHVPNGETLRMVYERVVPCFLEKILPILNKGMNVLVVGHGNSLRALMKYIENISDDGVGSLEMPFEEVLIYDLDKEGHMVSKESRKLEVKSLRKHQKVQIIVTTGPASSKINVMASIFENGADVVRLNFSWGNLDVKCEEISMIRNLESSLHRKIPIIADVPGPRIQKSSKHTFDDTVLSCITDTDIEYIKFAVKNNLDYVALSFVSSKEDIIKCRQLINEFGGKQGIIAKIERKEALGDLDNIIAEADAVMVARGDLGECLPIEELPFIQNEIIKKSNKAHKTVIVATEMLLSMVASDSPTRAEVDDVAISVTEGADVLMLSDETARGEFPVEAVAMMDKIISEAEKHLGDEVTHSILKKIT